jgi:hypothetical protein
MEFDVTIEALEEVTPKHPCSAKPLKSPEIIIKPA